MILIDLGNYGLKAAFVLAVFSMAASIWGGLRRRADMILAGRNAAVSVFALVAAAILAGFGIVAQPPARPRDEGRIDNHDCYQTRHLRMLRTDGAQYCDPGVS